MSFWYQNLTMALTAGVIPMQHASARKYVPRIYYGALKRIGLPKEVRITGWWAGAMGLAEAAGQLEIQRKMLQKLAKQ